MDIKNLIEASDALARYADSCALMLAETHPGKAEALNDRVSAVIAALTEAKQQGAVITCDHCDGIGQFTDPSFGFIECKVCNGKGFSKPPQGEAKRQIAAAVPDAVVRAVGFLKGVRVFVTSRERIKHPEGTDLFDESISTLEAMLAATPAASGEGGV